MSDATDPSPAQRLSRALSGRHIDPVTPARHVDHLTFTPINPHTLEAYDTVAPRPKDLDAAVIIAGMVRSRTPEPSVDAEVDAAVDAMGRVEIPVTVRDVTVTHRDRIPTSRGRYLAVILAACASVAVLLGLIPASMPAAQAATAAAVAVEGPGLKLAPGRNHKGRLHAGAYLLGGKVMYCVDYGLANGDGRLILGDRDMVQTYIVDKWGTTTNGKQAADVYLAVNSLLGNKKFNQDLPGYRRQLPDKGARVNAMVAEARRLAGPWKVTVTAPKSAPGTTVTAQVTVKSATGNPVPGVAVKVTAVGATVSAKATNGAGVAAVQVTPTALTYTVTASVTGPWGKVWTNTPSKGRQRLLGAGPNSTATGTACATICPVSARITIAAPCEGATRHVIDVQYTAEAIPGRYRAVIDINGTRDVTDLTAGESRTISTSIADGDSLTVGWEILDNTGRVVASKTLYSSVR